MTEQSVLPVESFAARLLSGSVKKSYDPVVDIDWDAPLDPDRMFLPPEVISLYGTSMWAQMSEVQRRELSRQELANALTVGLWFENVLNRILLRELLTVDPTSNHAHYTLTEMGDECRHMVMFGRLISQIEARPYRMKAPMRVVARALPSVLRGPMVWVGALLGEEIFDAIQRRTLDDPDLQPVVSRVMRVHVSEEARHISFARDSLSRQVGELSLAQRAYVQSLVAVAAPIFLWLLTNPAIYRRVGLDAKKAKAEALANPHFRQTRQYGFASLAEFLDRNGLLGRAGRRSWRACGFMA
ncbi:AurF N-oxygenase family protein [Smaragdicoccus niigatensis]|uniref:AurF N-oxygenase family protein n=1 Tax=Smaragdicoccus niigatensis TaxID=359359 RepID=UPI00038019D6|nr:diiron oxygenase [Smaragdicoccus niigatensis]